MLFFAPSIFRFWLLFFARNAVIRPRGSPHRDRLVSQHHGDVLPHDVQKFPVRADEAGVDFFGHGFAAAALQTARGDVGVETLEQRRGGDGEGLMRFGADEDRE